MAKKKSHSTSCKCGPCVKFDNIEWDRIMFDALKDRVSVIERYIQKDKKGKKLAVNLIRAFKENKNA